MSGPTGRLGRPLGKRASRPTGVTLTAEVSALPTLPEPGQVVEVRGSTWAVANVQAQGLPRSPADESKAKLSHIVELQSLDEDRLGEQLSVVWELEVGQTNLNVEFGLLIDDASLAESVEDQMSEKRGVLYELVT